MAKKGSEVRKTVSKNWLEDEITQVHANNNEEEGDESDIEKKLNHMRSTVIQEEFDLENEAEDNMLEQEDRISNIFKE